MLASIAEGLFWMGRYVKRSEHLARYLRVQYFSTIDATMAQNGDFTLRSILNMYGLEQPENEPLVESDVLVRVGLDSSNPSSIFSNIWAARENARSMRHALSTEIWESVNKFYHFARNYPTIVYRSRGLFEFTSQVEENVKIIQSNIYTTMIRNDEYHFIMTGVWLENSLQISRILQSKLIDADILSQNGENIPIQHYQWNTTLRTLEAYDMHNLTYRNSLSVKTVSDFLISDTRFPRSLTYNISRLGKSLNSISAVPHDFHILQDHVAQLENDTVSYIYKDRSDLQEYLSDIIQRLEQISEICYKIYFNIEYETDS